MRENAAFHEFVHHRRRSAVLALVAVLVGCLSGSAAAKPQVGKDGLIHACYRVKGKPKGVLRVVPSARTRCRRGERKATWSVAGQAGQQGTVGTTGSTGAGQQGTGGANGSNGSDESSEAALKTQVASLNVKIDALEKTLEGVTHADLIGSLSTLEGLTNNELFGAVDAVKGLTNGDLTEAVQAVPLVDQLCTQSSDLTEQANLLTKGLTKEVSLGGILPVGLVLGLPTISELEGFACGAP